MSKMPKISVIIPSYNHAAFVGEAIESILIQDYTDFELLIADDCSSDNSVEIIKTYEDTRIQTFFLNENLGATAILRFLIEQANGKYIALLNSDDIWCQGKLSEQVAFMEDHPDYAACFTWANFIDEDGNPLEDDGLINLNTFCVENRMQHEWLRYFYEHGNCLCHPSVLIRKSVYEELGYYNGAYRQLPDFDYWIRLCSKYPIHVIEKVLVNHRRTTGETENTSATTEINQIRLDIEIGNIFTNMIMNLDSDMFRRAFSSRFVDSEAVSEEELFCEKYFLLKSSSICGRSLKNQAYQCFMKAYPNEKIAKCFKEKYHYTEQDFFKENVCLATYDGSETDAIEYIATVYYGSEGFSENKTLRVKPIVCNQSITISFKLPEDAEMIRFDPIEGYGAVINSIYAKVNGIDTIITPLNCFPHKFMHIFLTNDPQYLITGNFEKNSAIEIVFLLDSFFHLTPYKLNGNYLYKKGGNIRINFHQTDAKIKNKLGSCFLQLLHRLISYILKSCT